MQVTVKRSYSNSLVLYSFIPLCSMKNCSDALEIILVWQFYGCTVYKRKILVPTCPIQWFGNIVCTLKLQSCISFKNYAYVKAYYALLILKGKLFRTEIPPVYQLFQCTTETDSVSAFGRISANLAEIRFGRN